MSAVVVLVDCMCECSSGTVCVSAVVVLVDCMCECGSGASGLYV